MTSVKRNFQEGVMQKKQNQRQRKPEIKVVQMDALEQVKKIHAAIAKRAYEIYERRGRACGHEVEDWEQAKGEILNNLLFGMTTCDHTMLVEADPAAFEPGTVEVWVAPRQLTVYGRPRANGTEAVAAGHAPAPKTLFCEIPILTEFNPDGVTARTQGSFLEVRLPEVARAERAGMAAAA